MQASFLSHAMEQHGDAVYRLALCRLQNIPDAEDVYQDVFLRLLRESAADWTEDPAGLAAAGHRQSLH